jgi:hypothetical protein
VTFDDPVLPDEVLAFPQDSQTGNLAEWRHGMTLRDYFAAKCLEGWIAHHGFPIETENISHLISRCYQIADAMLSRRKDSQ